MIPSDNIKKSIEYINQLGCENAQGDDEHGWERCGGCGACMLQQIIVPLLQSYLSAEMPEERTQKIDTLDERRIDEIYVQRIENERSMGFNEALRLCRLASVKDKMRVEELAKEIVELKEKVLSKCDVITTLDDELEINVLYIKKLEEALRKIIASHGNDKEPCTICTIAKSALANVKQGREG